MRRWLAPVAVLVIGLTAALWYQQQISRSRSRYPAPDFALRDLRGAPHRLSRLRGRVVLLNVWATWCAPCLEEMPSMELLHRRMRDQDFTILAVNEDEGGRDTVQQFVDRLGLTFPVLLDPDGEVPRKYGVTGYPETFLVDKDGTVVLHHVGFQNWADERVEHMLRQLVTARRDGA